MLTITDVILNEVRLRGGRRETERPASSHSYEIMRRVSKKELMGCG